MTRPRCSLLLPAVLIFLALFCTAASAASIGPDNHILVDLSHAERITIDGTVATDLDLSKSPVLVEWQAWADDMRRQGYTVTTHITGPVTKEVLGDTCILIIAEPDYRKSGVAYFTADEAKVISAWVSEGHTLLLQGQSFLGGGNAETYVDDYGSRYVYTLVINDLLKKMSIGLKFTAGTNTRPIGDIVLDPDATDMIAGSVSDIWVHEGAKSHPVWSGVPGGRFALFHGASINTPWNSASVIARGDAKSFSTRDTVGVQLQDPYVTNREEEGLMKRVEDITTRSGTFRLIVKKQGEYPVVMAETKHGCGTVVLYGDVAAWQDSAYWGPVYTNASYNNQKIASNLMAYLKKRCVDCEKTVTPRATTIPTTTRMRVTPVPPSQVQEGCQGCLDACYESRYESGVRLEDCVDACINPDSPEECDYCARYECAGTMEGRPTCYYNCMKRNSCSCPQAWLSCGGCIEHCISDDRPVNRSPLNCIRDCVGEEGFSGLMDCDTCQEACSEQEGVEGQVCYLRCMQDSGCSCPSTGQNCDSCVEACNAPGMTPSGRAGCINGCAGLGEHEPCVSCSRECIIPGGQAGINVTCYSSCIQENGCSCPTTQIVQNCESCISGCASSASNPTARMNCITGCSGGPAGSPLCQSCVSQCDAASSSALMAECYSHCMLQNSCTCQPTQTVQNCGTCVDSCDEEFLEGPVNWGVPAGGSDGENTYAEDARDCYAGCMGLSPGQGCSQCSATCSGLENALLQATCYSHCARNNGCSCPQTPVTPVPVSGCNSCIDACDAEAGSGSTSWGPGINRDCYNDCISPKTSSSCASCVNSCSTAGNTSRQLLCYSHCIRTNGCACPQTTPVTGMVFPRQTITGIQITPTPRPTVTQRITAIPRITLTPTAVPGLCSACLLECRGQRGASYSKCLGDCAAESGLDRNFCMPTLVPVTPSATVTATPSGAVCWGDFCILPGQQQQQPQQNCRQVCAPQCTSPNQIQCPIVCNNVCT